MELLSYMKMSGTCVCQMTNAISVCSVNVKFEVNEENYMENLSVYRYCIVMKKGRKILNMIVGCLMILISIIFITATVFSCIFMQEFVY